ncbi:hypothetical protein OOZ51_11715 [Arthrobacter sp. MI7-26]|uniref:hypothetical protein n=1 Tax=Arthrobacter sp. MI7-26 TaxID=2993653 RepID=UPI00224898B0|nr:hypothetical protein [Arthrobacter sp. MI7-26]MCX2748478.1 hypothetical protein [Arthrobacter sp. MI7-26]
MKTIKLILGPCLLLAGLLTGSAAAQAGTLPPTLVGETFVADRAASSFDVTSCPGSGSFTVHYVGTASGPYPGTFVEDVSVAVGLLPDGTPTLAAFHATFTITSATGAVTGTKDLASGATGTAFCRQARRHVRALEGFTAPSLTYSATISSGAHTYTDAGTASAMDTQNLRFSESFLTSQGLSPTAKDQCKKDGWMDYPQFKNQGQCIAYVNHQ